MSHIYVQWPIRPTRIVPASAIPVGPGTNRPIGLDIHKFCKWAYRAKHLRGNMDMSSVTISASGGGGSSATANGTSLDCITEYVNDPVSEAGLIARSNRNNIESYTDSQQGGDIPSGDFAIAEIEMSLTVSLVTQIVVLDAGLYYPGLELIFSATQSASAGASGSGSASASQEMSGSSTTSSLGSSFIVTLDGVDITVYYEIDPVSESTVGTGASVSIVPFTLPAITLAIDEYWPYNPGDGGGPIWDVTTGDKLRPNYI